MVFNYCPTWFLLFADDIVLLSDTIVGLQNQLDVLARNALKLDLHDNLDNTNIVIFRNDGYIAKKEVWYYGRQSISVVNTYKYLGLFLTTRMTFSNAVDEMANKVRKGVIDILRTLWRLENFSVTIFRKTFMQRLIDCHSQNWHKHVNNSTRFSMNRMFKTSNSVEPYFTSVTNKHIRDILIKFSTGASSIRVHKMRYVAHTPQDLLCPLCNTAYEDEMLSYLITND